MQGLSKREEPKAICSYLLCAWRDDRLSKTEQIALNIFRASVAIGCSALPAIISRIEIGSHKASTYEFLAISGLVFSTVGMIVSGCYFKYHRLFRTVESSRYTGDHLLQKYGLNRFGYECFMLAILQVWSMVPELVTSVFLEDPDDLNGAKKNFMEWLKAVLEHRSSGTEESYETSEDTINQLRLCSRDDNVKQGGFGDPAEFQGLLLFSASPLAVFDRGIIPLCAPGENANIQNLLTDTVRERSIPMTNPPILCLQLDPVRTEKRVEITPIIFNETYYEPIAAVCHVLSSPHYIAIVRDAENQWLYCNDDRILKISDIQAMNALSKGGTLIYFRALSSDV